MKDMIYGGYLRYVYWLTLCATRVGYNQTYAEFEKSERIKIMKEKFGDELKDKKVV